MSRTLSRWLRLMEILPQLWVIRSFIVRSRLREFTARESRWKSLLWCQSLLNLSYGLCDLVRKLDSVSTKSPPNCSSIIQKFLHDSQQWTNARIEFYQVVPRTNSWIEFSFSRNDWSFCQHIWIDLALLFVWISESSMLRCHRSVCADRISSSYSWTHRPRLWSGRSTVFWRWKF